MSLETRITAKLAEMQKEHRVFPWLKLQKEFGALTWNAQADEFNQWDTLDADERAEWIEKLDPKAVQEIT